MVGKIQLIIGPMFSGKTTELIRQLKRYQIAKKRCLVIGYYKDNRYNSDGVVSHDKQLLEAVKVSKLTSLRDTANDYDVIGIDEGQFFTDIVSFAHEMAERGKIVLVAALDSTFERMAFGEILQLIPIAENVVKLTAVCMNCGNEASFTKRIGSEKQVEIIGGADKYLSVCRECYPLDLHPSSPPKESKKMVNPQPSSPLKESKKMVCPQPSSPLKESKKMVIPQPLSPLKESNKMVCPPRSSPLKESNKMVSPQPSSPLKESNKMVSPQPSSPVKSSKKTQLSIINSQSPTMDMGNDLYNEDFQPPLLMNKINQTRGKLFSSP